MKLVFVFIIFKERKYESINSRIYKNNNNKIPRESRERRIKAKMKLNELEYRKNYKTN